MLTDTKSKYSDIITRDQDYIAEKRNHISEKISLVIRIFEFHNYLHDRIVFVYSYWHNRT